MGREIEAKAARLVLAGRVRVETVTFRDDGRIDEALGFVKGDTGTWMVEIVGDATSCNCPYGIAREDAGGHSHDIALQVAAKALQEQREKEGG